jgi:protein TBF1
MIKAKAWQMRRMRKRKSPSAQPQQRPMTHSHQSSPTRPMSQQPADAAPVAPITPQQSVSASQLALDAELFGSNTSIAMSLGAPPVQQVIPQSAPTQVLYERARMAATAKASPNARRAGLPSQRRPWTTEEENALMAGLDRVKGPHWSQILAMFGAGGTVSEVLKDRNQVQLKDKARNLKLFFLKSNIEVPYYLQFVTGELKTRAPGQALRNAAKKAVEDSANEDAAHVAAVTALGQVRANGHAHLEQMQNEINQGVAPMADMGMGIGLGGSDFKLSEASPAPVAPTQENGIDDAGERVDPVLGMDPTTAPDISSGSLQEVSAERVTA